MSMGLFMILGMQHCSRVTSPTTAIGSSDGRRLWRQPVAAHFCRALRAAYLRSRAAFLVCVSAASASPFATRAASFLVFSSRTARACRDISAARSAAFAPAATRFKDFFSAVRMLRASATSTRAVCRSADCASLVSAVALIFSTCVRFASTAVSSRSAKLGSLRDMSIPSSAAFAWAMICAPCVTRTSLHAAVTIVPTSFRFSAAGSLLIAASRLAATD